MKTKLLSILLLLAFIHSFSQSEKNKRHIKEILSNPFSLTEKGKQITFDAIVKEADNFFKEKYPNKSFSELTYGEFRDSDFVKYQRWKHFWKYRLNNDGTLGDFTTSPKPSDIRKNNSSCNDSDYNVQWTNTNYDGNFGYQIDMGRVSSIGFHPTDESTFIVGAAFGGLWKTVDGGQSYINLNDDLPHTSVADIIIDSVNPDRIFIALSDIIWYGPSGIGVYESLDGGQTFNPTSLTFTLPQNIKIYEMDVNLNNPSEFLVATSNGLYRTDNYFNTNNRIISGNIRSVKYNLNSNNAHAGGNSGQYYLSINNGQSFSFHSDFGSGQVRISVSNKTNSGYVAITNGNELNQSTDFGVNFSSTVTTPESNNVVSFANNSDSTILLGNFECYKTDNNGNNIQATSHWLGNSGLPAVHVDQRNIYTNPLQDDYVYYCNDGGVFRYSVSNNSFENLSSNLFITQYYDIAVSQTDPNILGGGSQDNGNVTRNSNGQWESYAPTGDGMGQEIDFNDPSIRYFSYQLGGLNRWENGSRTDISPPNESFEGAWETPFKLDPK